MGALEASICLEVFPVGHSEGVVLSAGAAHTVPASDLRRLHVLSVYSLLLEKKYSRLESENQLHVHGSQECEVTPHSGKLRQNPTLFDQLVIGPTRVLHL